VAKGTSRPRNSTNKIFSILLEGALGMHTQGSPQGKAVPRAPRKKRKRFYGEIPISGKILNLFVMNSTKI